MMCLVLFYIPVLRFLLTNASSYTGLITLILLMFLGPTSNELVAGDLVCTKILYFTIHIQYFRSVDGLMKSDLNSSAAAEAEVVPITLEERLDADRRTVRRAQGRGLGEDGLDKVVHRTQGSGVRRQAGLRWHVGPG